MNRPDEPDPGKEEPEPNPARSEEARRIIEEYLNEPKSGDDPNLQVDIFVLIK